MIQALNDPSSFLEHLDMMNASEAGGRRLFGGEQGMSTYDKMRAANQQHPEYPRALAETTRLLADVATGRSSVTRLQEAMSTSDFPLLFQDVLDRMTLAAYRQVPISWPNYIKRARVNDFRQVRRNAITGADTTLDRVKELAPYPESSLDEAEWTWRVSKFGRRLDLSWETMVNDDMDALKDIPERFGIAAAETEELVATQIFADANGPKATVINDANGNLIHAADGTANPKLSFLSLQAALTQMTKYRDPSGRPIVVTAAILVVPPALEFVANNILAATSIEQGTTSEQQRIVVPNWLNNRVKVVVNWYLPYVITTGTRGDTSWFLFSNPNVGRPAAELGFLRGHEEPEIFMKTANATRIGGGIVNPMDGDFDNDAIRYKVRHVTGGGPIDVKMMLGSNGTG